MDFEEFWACGCACALAFGIIYVIPKDYNSPKVMERNSQIQIKASPELSGYFPLRGFDYDKDGKLDKVERLFHGAPRIPFGVWQELDLESSLAMSLQKEYQNYLKD